MKIRTQFLFVVFLSCLLSLLSTLFFFNGKVEENIHGRLTSQARSICSLLSLYQNQCRSSLLPGQTSSTVHKENLLTASAEKLAKTGQDGIQIRYAARFPNNENHQLLKGDNALVELFKKNPQLNEFSDLVEKSTMFFRYVQPIFYQDLCVGCHKKIQPGPRNDIAPALLVVEIPYTAFREEQKSKFYAIAAINSAGYFAMFIVLMMFMQKTVLKRLQSLETAAIRLGEGTYDQVELVYRDKAKNEFDILTNAFYEMKKAVVTREVSLKQKRRQICSMFHSHQSIMFLLDAEKYRVLDVNVAAERFYDMSSKALKAKSFYGIHGISESELDCLLSPCLDHRKEFVELPYQHVGELRYLEVRLSPVIVDQKECLFLIVHDITAQQKARQQLRKEYEFFQMVIDNMVDPVLVMDTSRHIKKANRAAMFLADGKIDETAEVCCYEAFHRGSLPCDYQSQSCPMHTVLKTGKPASVIKHLDEKNKTYEIQAAPYFDDMGNILGVIESFRDITKRLEVENSLVEHERKIYDLTHYDSATGLPNRSVLIDRLNQAIYRALFNNSSLALLSLTLDRFKKINETMGHHVGDCLLQEIAQRLKKLTCDHSSLAKDSGSQFFLLIEGDPKEVVFDFADEVLTEVKQSFFANGQELIPSGSIGIAFYPDHAENATELLARADVAMRLSKDDMGGGAVMVYDPKYGEVAPQSLRMEADLKHALENNQLHLHYQPQFDLKNAGLVGVEALIRWNHPTEGPVSPGEFIPLAEETGLIHPLGRWVLREACRQAKFWQNNFARIVPVAVNVSSLQLKKNNFVHVLEECLNEFQIDPQLIELEITESAVMDRLEKSMELLNAIKGLGFNLAIDDFGTGYSSLSYLKKFPFSKLKIDRSFVMDLETDENDAAIITAIISMATSLGLKTIAEGVETVEQKHFLTDHGCDEVQGFLLSRPLSADAIEEMYLSSKIDA
ncbi:EAL domain-containing protein [Desulfuromonas acetoxidans]|uniref:Diguanylate cyclase/phosphodiesterase with PAS/PAC sensor(S) n=1 Tax=Desulfuromonas acetoxidans (strain DSM 684 / 11070) TaxID=281689 RepID=Q1JWP9_DESA6|nr:EAL domain-containing protein [Desulfuromonas acetoxidans]EAT14630.1 diguanylate cyclase/phosphodiesterase with PAS/PAC sensor(s) [Desulfuromonas acetoxidans DSM 684]